MKQAGTKNIFFTSPNGALHCIDVTCTSNEEVQLVSIVLVGGRPFEDLCSINLAHPSK